MLLKAKTKPSLVEQISELHRKIDELVAERAAGIKADCENQPVETIQQLLRRGKCPCFAALNLLSGD